MKRELAQGDDRRGVRLSSKFEGMSRLFAPAGVSSLLACNPLTFHRKGRRTRGETVAGRIRLWLVPLCALVSSCGGSDGSLSPTAPVTPTPTPTATPTSAPTPTGNETLLTLNSATQLTGYTGNGGYTTGSNGVITDAPNIGIGPGTPVVYDAQRNSLNYISSGFLIYGMPSSGGSVVLGIDSNRSDAIFAYYTGSSSGISYTVKQLRIGSSNPSLPLLYSSIAYATTIYRDPSTGNLLNGVVPFSFGLMFDPSLVSLTGSAAYDGMVIGNARGLGGSNVYEISGNVHVDVNYATTEFSGYIQLTGRNVATGQTVSLGQFNLLSPSKRGVLDYLISTLANGGNFQANFAGPRAQELLGGFNLQLPDPAAPAVSLRVSATLAAKKS